MNRKLIPNQLEWTVISPYFISITSRQPDENHALMVWSHLTILMATHTVSRMSPESKISHTNVPLAWQNGTQKIVEDLPGLSFHKP